MERYRKVTPADVRDAARKFDPKTRLTLHVVPEAEPAQPQPAQEPK